MLLRPSTSFVTRGQIPLTPALQKAATALHMGLEEWRASQDIPQKKLGCLPLPVQDLLQIGELRNFHLYEARFLALFENAIKSHGGCIGCVATSGKGDGLMSICNLCDVVQWERQKVGVQITLRCIGRARLIGLSEFDPYIEALTEEFLDEPEDADAIRYNSTPARLASEVGELYDKCVELERRLKTREEGSVSALKSRKTMPGAKSGRAGEGVGAAARASNREMLLWGHETRKVVPFSQPLAELLECTYRVLTRRSSNDEPSIGRGAPELLWNSPSKESERRQLISYVVLDSFDPVERLRGMATSCTSDRLEQARKLLLEKRNMLVAKASLASLQFSTDSESEGQESEG